MTNVAGNQYAVHSATLQPSEVDMQECKSEGILSIDQLQHVLSHDELSRAAFHTFFSSALDPGTTGMACTLVDADRQVLCIIVSIDAIVWRG